MKFRIPKLNYKQKTIRNIAAMILLIVFIWMNVECPFPTAEMEFRRIERKWLLDMGGALHSFTVAGETRMISVSDDWINLGFEGSKGLSCYPVEPEGTLIPIRNVGGGKGEHAVLAVGVPENAVSARLELDLAAGCYEWFQSDVDGENEHLIFLGTYHEKNAQRYVYRHFAWNYQIEGERLDSGLFLFRIKPHGQIENNITGEVKDLAEWDALDEIQREYLSLHDNRGLTQLVFRGAFYDVDGELVQELRLAPLEALNG